MDRARTSFLVVVACSSIAIAAPSTREHSSARSGQGPVQTQPKLTADEIFAHQTKQEGGGSPDAGRPIYEKQCAACHRFGEIGKDVGPDLTTIASRFKKKDVLESILWPSKIISDQYQSEMFELSDGTVVTGVLVRESATAVLVRTAENPDRPVAVPKAKIANRATSTVSLMPEGLLDGYTQVDIANMLAFVLAPPPAK
jgi:putative heme-binding domain-containing protein